MRVNYMHRSSYGSWHTSFSTAVIEGLPKFGISVVDFDVQYMTLEQVQKVIDDAPECDLWYFEMKEDWGVDYALDKGLKVACHSHNGIETGGFFATNFEQINPGHRLRSMTGTEFVTVNTNNHKRQIRKEYGDEASKVVVTGFPVRLDGYPDYTSTPKTKIVVPSRFSVEKQQFLLAHALEPWKERVVFTTHQGRKGPVHPEVLDTAKYLQRKGFGVLLGTSGHEYYSTLC